VLDALADALRLDEVERGHLFDLARAVDGIPASGRPRRRMPAPAATRDSLTWAIDALTDGVAIVRTAAHDIVATNALARAFYAPVIGDGGRTPNLARFLFLDPAARSFYPDRDAVARRCVAIMRGEAARDPHDRALQDLVGELSIRSEDFRTLWGAHEVRAPGAGTKRFRHPIVGELELACEELAVTADPGSLLIIATAAPGSTSHERLRLLASWAAESAHPETPIPTERTIP
jgi:hypothetical protein